MNHRIQVSRIPLLGTLGLTLLVTAQHAALAKPLQGIEVSDAMQQAAAAYLASLEGSLLQEAAFDFKSPHRTQWHFVPKDRVGVSFKQMNLVQRRAARVLMRSVLSEKGYLKAVTIMSLEQALRALEAGRAAVNDRRDPEKYWFAVFGKPEKGSPWGWRVEGHHLSLNFTAVDGKIASTTPLFFGANPAEIRSGPRTGLRVLGHEEDQARALLASLTEEQRRQVMISDQAPADVLTVPGKPVDVGKQEGLAAAEMTASQREQLHRMLANFVMHLRPALAKQQLEEIGEAGLDNVHFAWAGSADPQKKHYFRLHSPTFILEYDNAQGNHVHVVWHSNKNDFAATVLQEHYRNSPHHHGEGHADGHTGERHQGRTAAPAE